jgi:hypothetical protein
MSGFGSVCIKKRCTGEKGTATAAVGVFFLDSLVPHHNADENPAEISAGTVAVEAVDG